MLRYQEIVRPDGSILLNERGDVVFFQQYIPSLEADQTVDSAYASGIGFDALYASALRSLSAIVGRTIKDTDDTFLTEFRDGEVQVDWAVSKLPIMVGECESWRILTEALFVFSLRQRAEAQLHELATELPTRPKLRPMLRSAGDLVQVEAPQQFLVSERELALMSAFYEKWGLAVSIKSVQDRTAQLVNSYSLLFEQQQATRSALLNRFVAVLGVLALLSVSDTFARLVGLADSGLVDLVVVLIAGSIIAFTVIYTLGLAQFGLLFSATGQFLKRQRLRRMLKQSRAQTAKTLEQQHKQGS